MEAIIPFLRESIFKLEELRVHRNEMKIAMSSIMKKYFEEECYKNYSQQIPLTIQTFEGVRLDFEYPHINEIVVYSPERVFDERTIIKQEFKMTIITYKG